MLKTLLKWFFLIAGILCSASYSLCAQGEQNIWVFGHNIGVDFNSGIPLLIQTNFRQHEGCASICDASGKLLFYTRGDTVFDRTFNPMPNGRFPTSSIANNLLDIFQYGLISQTQAVVLVQMPGSPHKYYVFLNEWRSDYIKYYIVNMRLNNGLGDVEGPISTLKTSLRTEKISVTNADGCNFWLLTRTQDNSYGQKYLAYKITEDGVSTTPVVSPVADSGGYQYGVITFSGDGKKMAEAGSWVWVYDFDRLTGILSNPTLGDSLGRDGLSSGYGLCFSPDNSRLYVSKNRAGENELDSIYQYDLLQADVRTTRKGIGSIGSLEKDGAAGYLKMGPDRKIYHVNFWDNSMSVIHHPNALGTACGFEKNALFFLPETSARLGLPNEVGISRARDTVVQYRQITVCFKDSIKIGGGDTLATAFLWNTGAINDSITVGASGIYVLGYRKQCSYYIDSILVTFGSGNQPLLYNSNRQSCLYSARDTAAVLLPGNDAFYYQFDWYNAGGMMLRSVSGKKGDILTGLAPGSYSVRVTSQLGCDTLLPFTIEPPLPYKAGFTTDSLLCEQQTYTFQNNSTGTTDKWHWNFGDGTTSTVQHPLHRFEQPGLYRVTLKSTTPASCTDTFFADLVVDTLGTVSFYTSKTELCTGDLIKAYPFFTGKIAALSWDWGDNSRYESHTTAVQHAYDRSGIYPVTLRGIAPACPDILFTDTIAVYPLPVIFLGNDTILCPNGTPLVLNNSAAIQNGDSYAWSTGDTTSHITVMHPGIYTLTLTSLHNCSHTESIQIQKSCYLDIPNAFTPNADGINDRFLPKMSSARDVKTFHMQVFNRWGQLVFETRNAETGGWDGKLNQIPQAEGAYIYRVSVQLTEDKAEQYQGSVTLMR